MKLTLGIACFVLPLALATGAVADSHDPERGVWELGFFAGFQGGDKLMTTIDPVLGKVKGDLDNTFSFGLRASRYLGKKVTLELSAEYSMHEMEFDKGYGTVPWRDPRFLGDDDSEVNFLFIAANVLLDLPGGKSWTPYLTAGFGGTTIDPDFMGNDTVLGINAGIGIRCYFGESLGARLEFRDNWVDAENLKDDFWETEDPHLPEINLGLFWHWN